MQQRQKKFHKSAQKYNKEKKNLLKSAQKCNKDKNNLPKNALKYKYIYIYIYIYSKKSQYIPYKLQSICIIRMI